MPLGGAGVWILLAWPIFHLRRAGMPSDAFMLGPASELSFLVFVLGLGFASIGPGLLLANAIVGAILPSGDHSEGAKQESRTLVRVSGVILLVVYPISFVAGLNYFALAPDGVHYRDYLAVQPKVYGWQDIRHVRSRCYRTTKSPNGQYEIVFADGRSVNLTAYSEADFFTAYGRLSDALRHAPPFDFYFDVDASVSCPASWRPYFATRPGP